MFQTQPIGERVGRFIRSKSNLSRLVLINIAGWLVISIARVIAFLFQTSMNPAEKEMIEALESFLATPASFSLLGTRPWTLFTYMFLHLDFWHLFFNMLWLYWFGKIFLEFLTERRLLWVYLLGGISGGLAFVLAFNIFPAFSESLGIAVLMGASASVLAIVITTVVLVPDYAINLLFIGNVKIKYIAIVMVLLDILMLKSDNSGGHFAHLGGALAGSVYALSYKSGWLKQIPRFNLRFRRKRVKKVYSSSRPLTDEEYNRAKADNQKKIDGILDKIAKSGYKSLSAEEKEFLFRFSNK